MTLKTAEIASFLNSTQLKKLHKLFNIPYNTKTKKPELVQNISNLGENKYIKNAIVNLLDVSLENFEQRKMRQQNRMAKANKMAHKTKKGGQGDQKNQRTTQESVEQEETLETFETYKTHEYDEHEYSDHEYGGHEYQENQFLNSY